MADLARVCPIQSFYRAEQMVARANNIHRVENLDSSAPFLSAELSTRQPVAFGRKAAMPLVMLCAILIIMSGSLLHAQQTGRKQDGFYSGKPAAHQMAKSASASMGVAIVKKARRQTPAMRPNKSRRSIAVFGMMPSHGRGRASWDTPLSILSEAKAYSAAARQIEVASKLATGSSLRSRMVRIDTAQFKLEFFGSIKASLISPGHKVQGISVA